MDQSQTIANSEADQQLNIQHLSFSGPLPPPAVLAGYEKLVPGSAEKFINDSLEQAKHRRELETKVIDTDIRNSRIGLYFAFVIGLSGFIACIILAKLGYGTASSIIGGGTLIALVGAFIYGSQGKNYQQPEEENNQEANK